MKAKLSKIKKFFLIFITFFPFVPFLALAQTPRDFASLLGVFVGLLELMIPVLVSGAVLVFLWGVALFILKGNSETERAKGKVIMFWGIIGLFVMVSVWSLVGILEETFFSERDSPVGNDFDAVNNTIPFNFGSGN